jgi:predicted permease
LHTVARLAPGISHRKANAAVAAVSERLSQSFPEANRNTTLRVRHLWESTWGGQSLFLPLLRVLAVVAGLLLLLVIANVANLLLARAQGRQLEMGVRVALGASPFRIMRQLLVESICLALVGGAGGIALAVWGANALFDLMPTTYLPVGYDVSLNWTVVALITGLTISTGILFGLAPAVQAAGTNLNETLKAGARTSSGLGPRQWLRRAFVIGQVGLAFVLLLGMGLCVRSFIRARQIELGVDPRGVWVAGFKLSPHVGDSNAVRSFYQRLQYEAARLPGVEQVALADWLPLGFEGGSGVGVKIPGYVPAPGEDMGAGISYVSPGYFDVLHIRRVSGRDFTPADDAQAPLVGVVNETFARKFFGARDPVGLTFNCSRGDVRIVGVVQTGRYRTLNEREQPYMYLSTWQSDVRTLTLALRTAGDPKQLAQPVERVAVAIHPLAAPTAAMTYEDYVAAAFTTPRLAATLLSLLGVLALALAILGLFAVMSQNVEQRIREMGIRLALGAQPRELRRLIVQQGLWLTAAGLVLGGITGFAVSRLLSGLLVGISAADVVTWVLVPLLLLGAAMGTCWVPARRASKVNPMVALRTE